MARRSLMLLSRTALGSGWVVRSARTYGWFTAIGFAVATWIASRGYGADDTVLLFVGRAAGVLAWVVGLAALGLSAPPKRDAFRRGVLALARARGVDEGSLPWAEAAATVRLLGEIAVLPMLVLTAFVWLVVARGNVGQGASVLIGCVAFAAIASGILGLVASACRSWGQGWGRGWFLLVVLLPWPVAELALPARVAELASIPGLLTMIWEALTGASS
jgi:hypothetical protein